MKKQITRISVIQSSKIVTAIYFLFSFLYTLVGIPLLIFGGDHMRVMAIIYIAMPIFMAILGFLFFALFCLVYNLIAKWLGGFEFEVTEMQ
jgi:hypothetical protein